MGAWEWVAKTIRLRREPPVVRKVVKKAYVWQFPMGNRIVDTVVEDKGPLMDRIGYTIYKNPWKSLLVLLAAFVVVVVKIINTWFEPSQHVPPVIISMARILRSFWTLASIIWEYKWNLWLVDEKVEEQVQRQCHTRSARRLLHLCLQNGGLFIKAGQHIASLNNILPEEYCTIMAPCQDQAPRRPWKEMSTMFEKEFGKPVESFFSEFLIEPIAAASLAQVYRARLHDGTQVAVKMQYPSLLESSAGDVKVMQALVKTAEFFFPQLRLQWLIDEFKVQLPRELDFENEVHNSEAMNQLLSRSFSNVRTPKIFHEVCSKRIITMEYIDGVKISDKRGLRRIDADPAYVCKLLTEVYSHQIFKWGFVHCDPHPGNILIHRRKDSWWGGLEMVLLDHGLCNTIDSEFQYDYAELWKNIVLRDEDGISRSAKKLGVDRYELFAMMLTSRKWDKSDIGMSAHMGHKDYSELRQIGQRHFTTITQVLASVNRKMLLLLKCNDLLRSLQMELGVPINYFAIFCKYAMRAICHLDLKNNPTLFEFVRGKLRYMHFSLKLWMYMWIITIREIWSEAWKSIWDAKRVRNTKRVRVVRS